MNKFTTLTSRVVPLLVNDIDTDQIIPARFLKATDKIGLGKHLFADWRYQSDGSPKPEFTLNASANSGAQILLAGDNFGCGSSREHAPWALTDFGFRAIISTSFADIFCGNAMKNGLLPVALKADAYSAVKAAVERHPEIELTIDLSAQRVSLPAGQAYPFDVDAFARTCLLNGVDELGYILEHEQAIEKFEQHQTAF